MESTKETIINFSGKTLESMYDNEPKSTRDDTCRQYILNSIFPLKIGEYVIFQKDKMRIVKAVDAEKQYINRFPEKLKRWYKKSNDIIFYDLTSDSSTDVIVNRAVETINVAPRIKAEYKPYKSFTDEQKSKVNIILDHILTVNCSNDKEQYNYLLKIIKNMCNGVKNNIIVVLSGISEGTGKSAVTSFLQHHVIGSDATCLGEPNMIDKGFNYPMHGKRFILFEEIDRCMKSDKAISTLKTWSTEKSMTYEDKGQTQFQSINYHTIWGTSNDITHNVNSNGRRYFLLDVSSEKKGDTNHFQKLNEAFRDDIGSCFYSYLQDNVTVENDFGQKADIIMPITKNKKSAIAELLPKPLVFIKETYVVKNLSICSQLKDLYAEYEMHGKYFKMGIRKFSDYLRESPLKKHISLVGGYSRLKINANELREVYTTNNWLTEFDEIKNNINKKDIRCQIEEYENEIKRLKNLLDNKHKDTDEDEYDAYDYGIEKSKQSVFIADDDDDDDSDDDSYKSILKTNILLYLDQAMKKHEQKPVEEKPKKINKKVEKIDNESDNDSDIDSDSADETDNESVYDSDNGFGVDYV